MGYLSNNTIKIQERILLTKAIRKKDRKALGQLHRIYYSRLRHHIASCIKSFPDAEDLIQNLFFELCKGNGHYDSKRGAEAYLFGIARNLVNRYYRDRCKYPQTVQLEKTVENTAFG
jgi:RNA polymerase sigma-70 factor (ECF subfamily)